MYAGRPVRRRVEATAAAPARPAHARAVGELAAPGRGRGQRGDRTPSSRSSSRPRATGPPSRQPVPRALGRPPTAAGAEATGDRVDLDDARAYAAWARRPPARPRTSGSSRPPTAGLSRRDRPAVWNWTESEHTDGRTRFVMLKGGSDHRSEGSTWYFDGGVQPPEFCAKLLAPGPGPGAPRASASGCAWTTATGPVTA